jgi:hypothetical protein
MEGQLLPAQARFQAASMTASPKATAAKNETRMLRRARGESLTRALSELSRRAMVAN